LLTAAVRLNSFVLQAFYALLRGARDFVRPGRLGHLSPSAVFQVSAS
jgi:hypothetical protein